MKDREILDEISSILKVRKKDIPQTLIKFKKEIEEMKKRNYGEKQ